jgi:hypothetical protein
MFRLGILLLLAAVTACSDMNDKHDEYIRDGEIIYTSRIDSAKIMTGNQRFLLKYWINDPRVEELKIYWLQKQDSLIIPVPAHAPSDSIEVIVNNVPEGNHTVQIYTAGNGYRSVVYEQTIEIYGDNYAATLSNRALDRIEFVEATGLLSLFMYEAVNSKEYGIWFSYTDTNGVDKDSIIQTASVSSPVRLPNVEPRQPVSFRIIYLPEPAAIDTFYTNPVQVVIEQNVNVALNKPVSLRSGDFYNSASLAEYAVDGIINDGGKRWTSLDDGQEHWIEIDLQQEYSIFSFATYIGAGGTYGYPVANFKFQADVSGQWEDIVSITGNTNAQYTATFQNVSTSKVRYYIPPYASNMVRLYEIEVYTKMRY